MAIENSTTVAGVELPLSNIPVERIAIAQEASYELEALAINFPLFGRNDNLEVADEYHQKLFVRRIKELARVVMSSLTDDRETNELRRLVDLEEVSHG